jgi:hypothetical protein
MLKIPALLCAALTITACGKSSPTAPSQNPAGTPDRVEQPNVPDTPNNPRPPRKTSDEHGEPPGNLPPRP